MIYTKTIKQGKGSRHLVTTNTAASMYKDLREKITRGVLTSSANLTEAELAAQYGVSRNTVKKALLMLAGENFITIEPNKSARVKTYSPDEVLEHLEARAVLEGLIARLSVQKLSKSDIRRLEDTMGKMSHYSAAKKLMEYSEQNQVFHQVLYDACPNKTVVGMTSHIKAQIRKYNTKTILVPGRDDESIKEHEAIFNAIVARDPFDAEQQMIKHISKVRDTFEQHYRLLI